MYLLWYNLYSGSISIVLQQPPEEKNNYQNNKCEVITAQQSQQASTRPNHRKLRAETEKLVVWVDVSPFFRLEGFFRFQALPGLVN